MTKFWTLVGLTFKQQYRVKPSSANGKNKKITTILMYVVLGLIFVPVCVSVFIGCMRLGAFSAQSEMSVEKIAVIVGLLLISVQGITLLFGFSGIITNVFNCKDADKLLYLPVSTSMIFLSKFFVAYVNEVLVSALLLTCTVLPFGIGYGMGLAYYLMLVPSVVFVPLLPMLVATIFAMPVSWLTSKIGKNGTVRTVFNIVLYLVVIAVYLFVVQYVNNIGGKPSEDITQSIMSFIERIGFVVKCFHPDYMLAESLISVSFVDWLLYTAAAVGEFFLLAALLFVLSKLFYGRLLSVTIENGSYSKKKKVEKLQVDKKGGVLRNLVISDFKRVVRDPQMGFQAFAGMILVPLVVVVLGFGFNIENDDGTIVSLQQLVSRYGIYFGIGLMAYLMLLTGGTNVLGLYPISRENKQLYLLKTLPIPFGKILLAKVVFATFVMLSADVVTALVAIFIWGLNPLSALLMTLGLLAYGFGNMCFTTKMDLKSPKLGWSNFQTDLKNAKNSWFAMFLGLLCCVAIGLCSVGFLVWYAQTGMQYVEYLMWIAVDLAGCLYAWLSYRSMTSSAERLFEEIEP